MRLAEVFDSFAPFTWHKQPHLWGADFDYKGESFQLYIGQDKEDPSAWDIYFGAPSKLEMDADALSPTFSKENMLKVYSTVVQAVTEFINQNEHRVRTIGFAGYHSATWDLYQRIAKSVKLPSGWSVSIFGDGESVMFTNENYKA